ncbi:MAG: carboxypeptidase regulatory-like domain-containing protein, partial [Acidobacteria bacterium]|nr:carboxypeptidase regulatory-like domain-containing protein [Acidobacteriota bacterium]
VSSNTASGGEGGAIRHDGTGNINITGSIFSGNSATNLGCIHNNNTGTVNITNTLITNNSAQFDAGAINNGNNGPGNTNVTNCIITNNTAGNVGGAIKNGGTGTVTVTNSTIGSNSASSVGGGIYNNSGTITVNGSTFSGNSSNVAGGGGIYNGTGTINLTNSTFSGNNTGTATGGGVYFASTGLGTITGCTFTANSSGLGGGIRVSSAAVTIKNTIIAGNTGNNDIGGPLISGGYNLIGSTTGGTITPTTGDQFGTSSSVINAQLGPLQNNGGPTSTHALGATSPAIDAGNAFTLLTDQRGFTRPVDDPTIANVSDGTDIGAFETGNWVWTGANSADWNTAANWFSNTVPPAWATAVVPTSGVTNNPSLNTPASQQGLIVEPGRTMTLTGSLNIGGVLDIPGGLINAGTFTLTVDANGVVNRTGGYVIGNLRKIYNAGAVNFIFPVGTANGYSPVTANTTAGSGAGELTIKAVESSHPQLNPATSLKRYWTLTGTGITANLTFNYLDPLDISGNEANYRIMKINGSSVVSFANNCPGSPCVAPASNTATVNGVSSFSDWTLSEGAGPTAIEADISGRVTYAGGRPMRGVLVTLFNLSTSQMSVTQTDAKGRYRFTRMLTGRDYIITAGKEGYDFNPANMFYTHLDARADLNFAATRVE